MADGTCFLWPRGISQVARADLSCAESSHRRATASQFPARRGPPLFRRPGGLKSERLAVRARAQTSESVEVFVMQLHDRLVVEAGSRCPREGPVVGPERVRVWCGQLKDLEQAGDGAA